MAKELPYFKFEPGAWDNGTIQMCSREVKGLFIDLCSIYWARLGELPYALALQKLCGGNEVALQELKRHNILGVVDGNIIIEFLDEQLQEFNQISQRRRENAQKRWNDANALQKESKSNAIRREEKREEEKREEKINTTADAEIVVWPSFEDFWNAYGKKVDRPKCEKKWNKLGARAREDIMHHLEDYVRSTPDVQYRRNPLTYLNNNSWENDIITRKAERTGITAAGTLNRLNSYSD